jgi:hypothetical protein
MRRLVAIVLVILLAAVGGVLWRAKTRPVAQRTIASSVERVHPPGCDPLPPTPALPATLPLKGATIDAVVGALDSTLAPAHKTYVRCLPDEDELVARTHYGMGRWLRGALHLYRKTPLSDALRANGAKNPDEMSAMIVRAYSRSLRGMPIGGGVER